MLLSTSVVECRGVWGSKKKRSEDEENDFSSRASRARSTNSNSNSHSGSNSIAAGSGSGVAASRRRSSSLDSRSMNVGLGEKLGNLIDTYISMMEKLIDSPDFDSIVTPEYIKEFFTSIPMLSDNPDLATLLESPQFTTDLRNTISEGIVALKMYSNELIAIVSDPAKMDELVAQVPDEFRPLLQSIASGDLSLVKEYLNNLPGIGDSQRQMLSSLLDGDSSEMTDSVQDILSDPEQVEAARLQFLENPEMAEMLGIPSEILNDKMKWSALMAEGLEALASEDHGEDVGVNGMSNQRLFGGSAAL